MDGFHDSGLENEWWWVVWRDGVPKIRRGKARILDLGMDSFHDSGLGKEWWWVVWRGGFRDSSLEKQAIHPKNESFRESSLENGMLPHLGRCFHDSSPEKL